MEFAIAAPVLLYMFVAASDFGLAWWDKGCLANAVAQGGYYAFRTGPTVSQSSVKSVVQTASSLTIPLANITTTDPTQCYCPSGTPATLGSAQANCTTTCADGTTAGNYMTITATYTLHGFFPSLGVTQAGKTATESVTVRLQ